jgi:hypothetical protein
MVTITVSASFKILMSVVALSKPDARTLGSSASASSSTNGMVPPFTMATLAALMSIK